MRLMLPSALVVTCAALPAQLSGAFLIDPTNPSAFPSFTAAVNALFVSGVNGPVEVLVAPGTYTESVLVPPIAGTSTTNTITFRSLNGPGTVLLGGAAGDTFALLAVAFQQNLSMGWDGIDFTGGNGHAIFATQFVENVTIQNCRFTGAHRSTASGEFRHATIVIDNSQTNALGWKVHHNTFLLNSHTTRTSYGIYMQNCGEWDIYNNTFDMNGADYGLYMINNNRRIDRVYNNLFIGSLYGTTSTSYNSTACIKSDVSNHENYFVHNTFAVNIPTRGACIATGGIAGTSPAQSYIFGNVFFTTGTGVAVCLNTSGTTAQPLQADGNIYFCPGSDIGRIGPSSTGTAYNTLAAWQTASGVDTNSQETDPQLQNPFGTPPDLRPQPTSPVAGAARNTPAYVTEDFAGRLRDSAPDAGAYESTSFALFGTACPGTAALAPAMSNSGTAAIGSTNFAFELTQAPANALAILFGGLSRTQSGAVTLPFALGGGCFVYVAPDAPSLLFTSPTGTATSPFPIPNNAGLIGFDLFFQIAVTDPGSGSSFGITTTEGGALQL